MTYTVFGYGSLIFKPPPHTVRRQPGYVKGYVRRFAQSSWDHRGTPERPGRVVTIIPWAEWHALAQERKHEEAADEEDIVWGVAYTIDPAFEDEVRAYLDYREKNGYSVHTEDIYNLVDGKEQLIIPQCILYVGLASNPSFVGPEPLDYLSHRIWSCTGPSGRNRDYLYGLAKAIRELAPGSHDVHLANLEARVQALEAAEGEGKDVPGTSQPTMNGHEEVSKDTQ
ncbi:ChaC-like protein [Calocera cornea HHB12733]|uniref:glutathione-specific gamma-glutamylcyclotransferase n=1 Tax=Calocera cornea HHB12733 TaxID=1353952 RepID=A0A165JI45_9BASI|nr:ChaC-like protein [Calocera cornea HHB12733]